MKLNKFFMLGLAGLSFIACSNEEEFDPNDSGKENKVLVNLTLGRASTKSLSESAANLYNNINNLDIVFYNAGGAYIEAPETVENDDSYSKNKEFEKAKVALQNNQEATLTIKGVPVSAKYMYIVVNQPQEHAIGTSSLDDAKKSPIYLADQVTEVGEDYKFSGINSTLTGLGEIGPTDAENIAEVSVELRPVPSRIEIADVRAIPLPTGESWGGANIKSFIVAGFYINSFYTSGSLDPDSDDAGRQRVDNASDANKYTMKSYANDGYSYMCDEPTNGQMTSQSGADVSKVIWENITNDLTVGGASKPGWWGYQILQGEVPHIVVKLNVTFDDDTTAIKFLTITKFKRLGDSGVDAGSLQKVERGKVYRIENIDFDVTDLTDIPYEGTKTVSAEVQVLAWIPVPIAPDFD